MLNLIVQKPGDLHCPPGTAFAGGSIPVMVRYLAEQDPQAEVFRALSGRDEVEADMEARAS